MAKQAELASLTSARGIAAWLVVFYHIRAGMSGWAAPWLLDIFAKGYLAVDFFFILSGFVIYLSSHSMFEQEGMRAYPRFMGRRIARIYPLYAFILLGTIAFVGLMEATGHPMSGYPWRELPLHFAMMQNWGFTTELTWNHPAWSISCEFAAYLLFPIIVLILPIARLPRWSMPCVAALVLTLPYWIFSMAGHNTLGADITQLGLARCLPEFAAGAMIAAWWLRGDHRHSPLSVWISIAISTLILASWILGPVPETLAFPIAMAAIIYGLAHASGLRGNILDSRFLHYIGQISYATYLSHFMLYIIFKLLFVSDRNDIAPLAIMGFLAGVFIASVILYHGVERPGQKLFQSWFNTWFPPAILPNGSQTPSS